MKIRKIGDKIAEARKKISISQAQLAERLFISPQAVGKWERGESMPDITTFNRLAEILGVDLMQIKSGGLSGVVVKSIVPEKNTIAKAVISHQRKRNTTVPYLIHDIPL